jgi:hypothetical protein
MMIKLDKLDCQIILYTKSWFKQTNQIEDIKTLMICYYGTKAQYYNLFDVYRILIDVMESVEIDFARFMKEEMFRWNDNTDPNSVNVVHIIERMLGIISIIPVRDNEGNLRFDLGEPDYTWLPKKEGDE